MELNSKKNILQKFLEFLGLTISVNKRKLLIGFSIFFVVSVIAMAGLVKYSTMPSFCNNCHIMEPYYNAWKSSKHKNIACTECHYTPGLKNTIWQKFQALSQVAKYVTRTYSSKPHADIEDSSCLRSGCHSTRLLDGKVTFSKNISFDHTPHLGQLKRGKKLRCSSCHSQIVVGNHIEVTTSTCFICHFKHSELHKRDDISNCMTCHQLPEKDFMYGKVKYNHKQLNGENGKIDCKMCHNVVQGEGLVPIERCYSCHNDPQRLEKKNDTDFLHTTHMTTHNIPCFQCHQEIIHKNVKLGEMATNVDDLSHMNNYKLECNNCHVGKHNGVLNMFLGQGGKGIEGPMPVSMYTTNVHCIGCHEKPSYHTNLKTASDVYFDGKDMKGTEKSCSKCHDPSYATLLDRWKETFKTTLELSRKNLSLLIANKAAKEDPLLKDVEFNLEFIEDGKGIHNVYYSSYMFRKSNEFMTSVAEKNKVKLNKTEENIILNGKYCLKLCHEVAKPKIPEEREFAGVTMPHQMHWQDMEIPCSKCHEIGKHKELHFKSKEETCLTCHEKSLFE